MAITKLTKGSGDKKVLNYCKTNGIKLIPFKYIYNEKPLAVEGSGTIYIADLFSKLHNRKVILKSINTPENIISILETHKKNNANKSYDECYGITKKKNYAIVLKYAQGDLCNYLSENINKISWEGRVKSLLNFSIRLKKSHSEDLVHLNLHSRSILIDKKCTMEGLGLLCEPVKEDSYNNKAYGYFPYLAPEILAGKPYTKESDIYSFGMIMWVYASGKEPFHDRSNDIDLTMKILEGEKPDIASDIPDFYAKLMWSCWEYNPTERPTAKQVENCLNKNFKKSKRKLRIGAMIKK